MYQPAAGLTLPRPLAANRDHGFAMATNADNGKTHPFETWGNLEPEEDLRNDSRKRSPVRRRNRRTALQIGIYYGTLRGHSLSLSNGGLPFGFSSRQRISSGNTLGQFLDK